jgi:hypothetical protein
MLMLVNSLLAAISIFATRFCWIFIRATAQMNPLVHIPEAYERIIPTDCFFAHHPHPDHKAEALIELKSGSYRFIKQYSHAGLSGWNWYLCHHETTTQQQ